MGPGAQPANAAGVVFEDSVQPERGSLMRQQAEQLGSVHREGCVDVGGSEVYQMANWHRLLAGRLEWFYRLLRSCWFRRFWPGCRARRCASLRSGEHTTDLL